ncbi:MAG TPA: SpvB/TcaC N-terminal domain-containing protein, partial [Anaerolineales bacterium]|nr:SpvB/TcaC N-terminal domain-containing protein [Anaerolineales bacterium]
MRLAHRVRQWKAVGYRFVTILSIIALSLPPGVVQAALAQQVSTPVETPIETLPPTATATSTATDSPTAWAAPTDTPSASPSAIDTPTPEATPTSTETPVVTATPTASADSSLTPTPSLAGSSTGGLTFTFSVSPQQAAPGDKVTFTIVFTNTTETAFTDIQFTDTVPDVLKGGEGRFGDLVFDLATRLLTWSAKQILPEQTITLQYTLTVGANGASQKPFLVVDSALLTAAELAEPLKAETSLLVTAPGQQFNRVDASGGKALGLNGKVEIDVPNGALAGPQAIVIDNARDLYPAKSGEIWTVFEVNMLGDPAASLPNAVVEGTLPTNTPVATLNAEATATANPGSPTDTTETDKVLDLQPVEARFEKPVKLTVSFDGLADLSTLTADYAPFLVTLDEASGVWVRVPIVEIDRQANTISAEVTHFSPWGAGVGSSFPQSGANLLLFDSAYPSLFTGRSSFSIPIWTPPGRNGLAPNLALTYSSGTTDGVLGDIQAPWVGMGWSIGTVEIVRKITNGNCSPCGGPSYGYKNDFLLLFNGTGYELIQDGTQGRYHTLDESFLYIQRHNDDLGNNSPAAQNTTGEWWEVVARDGTRWRLGWDDTNAHSEQLAAMAGYPGAATGAWSSLGYAGNEDNLVTGRWRADYAVDPHGNTLTFTYDEETRAVAGFPTFYYDRANYLKSIVYTGHTSGTPTAAYSVDFLREPRYGDDVPTAPTDWDNWDTERLNFIHVKYNGTIVRTYDLNYAPKPYVIVLESVVESSTINGGAAAPTVSFTYEENNNKEGAYPYPRLKTITNGWGGTATFEYENDGRPATSWYNYRVKKLSVSDGVSGNTMQTDFAYALPCYKTPDTISWTCTTGDQTELVGYGETTVTTKDFGGTTTLAIAVHKFHTSQQKVGRESEVQYQDANGTILSQTNTTYTVVTAGLPPNGFFTYPDSMETFLRQGGALNRITRTEYQRGPTTGNLEWVKESDGTTPTPTLYRQTQYDHQTNTSPSVWILDRLWRQQLKDAGGVVISEQQYGYDNNAPNTGILTKGELTLSQVVSGGQAINTAYLYDTYGNVTNTRVFTAYGTPGALPSGAYRETTVAYDTGTKTYAESTTNPLSQTTSAIYDFRLGLPTTMTDSNGSVTTTAYDALGRVTGVTYMGYRTSAPDNYNPPNYLGANVRYIYPAVVGGAVSAPFAVQMDTWDETANVYHPAWTLYDGLGRTVQAQGPTETSGQWLVTDTGYDARGLVKFSGLPRTVSGAGGVRLSPPDSNWTNVPHSTTSYDAVGRVTTLQYSDNSVASTSYDGLRTTFINQNNYKTVQEIDAFGRLVKVEEYTGGNPYTLYATTSYQYNERDQLKQVTDAQTNVTTILYGDFGRKTGMTDPDMGAWSYGYDVFGNLTGQTDARGCVTTLTYDALNRLTGKTYAGPGACDSAPDVAYTYDSTAGGNKGIGYRTGMTDGSGATSWVYNALGQVTSETRTIDGAQYVL